jgi:uncharacterized protein (TIGR03435 family)
MRVTGVLLLAFCSAFGQSTPSEPAFEVASVKASPPIGPAGVSMIGFEGGPGTSDPGRIASYYTTLKMLIMKAYDVKSFQVSGPAWLDTEMFDVVAKVPPGATQAQVSAMLRTLLIERFKLEVHREKKDIPVYALTVAKEGAKLKASDGPPAPPAEELSESRSGPTIGKDGFPVLRPGALAAGPITNFRKGQARMQAANAGIQALADALSGQLDRLVVDETGLSGKYDWSLYWTPDRQGGLVSPLLRPPEPGEGGVNLPGALHQQLGLRLEPKKAPVDTIVVDHMEKSPAAN